MKQCEFKDYIMSLGFIDNTKNWYSTGSRSDTWFTWSGSKNNAILMDAADNTFTIFNKIRLENGLMYYTNPIHYKLNKKNLKAVQEMREKIINFKKQQRFKMIEEL